MNLVPDLSDTFCGSDLPRHIAWNSSHLLLVFNVLTKSLNDVPDKGGSWHTTPPWHTGSWQKTRDVASAPGMRADEARGRKARRDEAMLRPDRQCRDGE